MNKVTEKLHVDPSVPKRIDVLRQERGIAGLKLRITVDGGGCAGFQYKLELTDAPPAETDVVFDDYVITDNISLPFLKDATVSYEEGLIGSDFKIDNPNAVSGCGCGTSFSV